MIRSKKMIKAMFIGTSDDFFTNGVVYNIVRTWVGNYPTERCNYGDHQYIWVEFSVENEPCPFCGSSPDLTDEDYRQVPYSSLNKFLENWEVIYE